MFFNEQLETYIQTHSQPEDPILQELSRETYLKMLHPRMLSGHIQGQLLEMISKMMQPLNILELGTYTGYSAICLAKGLHPKGRLITIDVNDEVESIAQKYFEKSGLAHQIEMRIGDALELIDDINETLDLVFIDASKSDYLGYYQKVLPKVRQGGVIIADNVLWSGKVVETKIRDNDYFTKGILAFNEFVQKDDSVHNFILPMRDGMMMMQKK